jgi:hypothetical protein
VQKNLQRESQKDHTLIESFVSVRSEHRNPTYDQSLGRLAQLVRARASHAQQLKGRMSEAVGLNQLLVCALRVVSGR